MTANCQFPITAIVAATVLSIAPAAQADNGPYRIEELFSNGDGKLQFVQLANVDRDKLAGITLTISDGTSTKVFTFPATSNSPLPQRGSDVVIISQTLAQRASGSPDVSGFIVWGWDYVMPDGFIPVSGGTIVLEGLERWDFGRVPTDGFSALYQPADIGVHNANSSLAGVVIRFGLNDFRPVTEFANATMDRHFFTAFDGERKALLSGTIAGWHPLSNDIVPEFGDYTGYIGFGRRVDVLGHPVCRFYLPPPADSHFFTASEAECAEVQARFPNLILETDTAMYAGLPDPDTGACAIGTSPVYRLWNPASNDHWFTADDNARDRALARGYIPEGYGPKGVSMCTMLYCTVC